MIPFWGDRNGGGTPPAMTDFIILETSPYIGVIEKVENEENTNDLVIE